MGIDDVTPVSNPRLGSWASSLRFCEAIETASTEHVTRLPVHGENRDDVVGIVDVRDAIRAEAAGGDLASATREATFVPASKPVDELFAEMRDAGNRMVIVVDEFGAVVGLATMEDVIEEVVGELVGRGETEHVRVTDAGTAVVSGWTTVTYLNESLGVTLPTAGEFETVAGLITETLGRLPEEGDRVEFGGVALTVTVATPTHVTRVRVEHPVAAPGAAPIEGSRVRAGNDVDAESGDDIDADGTDDH